MKDNNAIAFSLVIVAAAFLAGCGCIAGALNSEEFAVGAIGASLIAGVVGFVSLWAECSGNWGFVKEQIDSVTGSFKKKPIADEAKD